MAYVRELGRVGRFTAALLAAAAACGVGLVVAVGSAQAAKTPIGAYTTRGAWSFVSAPSLHPPKLLVDARAASKSLAPGDFLLANFPDVAAPGPMTGEGGPLIVGSRLQPVWFRPVGTGVVSADLQQEDYLGKPVLVWWQGIITATGATESGEVAAVDQHYRTIATLRARRPWVISLHDATISGADMWVTVYRDVPGQNLAAYGGPAKGTVFDAGVQEYNLKTGALLYTWDALNPGGAPNVPLSDSEQPVSTRKATGGAWDAYHVDSVQVLTGNQILVSMRNTWAAYLIDVATGKIVWTLGGKPSMDSFTFASNARFSWQHDVELLAGNEVTLFNDNCCRVVANNEVAHPNGPSQGMVLRLDTATHTVSLVASYPHRPARESDFLGSMQLLPNANALVGWGSLPYLSEFAGSGKLLLDATFPGKDQSYRALYTPSWQAIPYYPPSVAARSSHGRTTVYASWNGATGVSAWEVLAGAKAAHLKRVAIAPDRSFETAITLTSGGYKAFRVEALDAKHHVIGSSRVVG